jgi:hypothetical protein
MSAFHPKQTLLGSSMLAPKLKQERGGRMLRLGATNPRS